VRLLRAAFQTFEHILLRVEIRELNCNSCSKPLTRDSKVPHRLQTLLVMTVARTLSPVRSTPYRGIGAKAARTSSRHGARRNQCRTGEFVARISRKVRTKRLSRSLLLRAAVRCVPANVLPSAIVPARYGGSTNSFFAKVTMLRTNALCRTGACASPLKHQIDQTADLACSMNSKASCRGLAQRDRSSKGHNRSYTSSRSLTKEIFSSCHASCF